jgi:hypothetical protein
MNFDNALTIAELDRVSGGKNEQVGEKVVNSMWDTIIAVEGIIAANDGSRMCGFGVDCPK